jgi:exopolysaccharide production protein ExoQ
MFRVLPASGASRGRDVGGAVFVWLTLLAIGLSVTLGAIDGASMGTIVPAYALLGFAALALVRGPLGRVDGMLVALVLTLLVWMVVAAVLADRGARGLGRVAQMATVLIPLLLLMPLAAPAAAAVRRALPAAAIGGALVAALLGVELLFDAPVARALWGQYGTRYNRGLVCLVILAWPLAAAVGPRLAFPLLVAVGFMAGASESATARLAFAAGTVVALCALVRPRATVVLAAAVGCALALGAPILFGDLERLVAITVLLPSSWVERIDIWRDAYRVILDAPWAGHGLRMMRDVAPGALPPVMAQYTHLHNVMLQLWLDLGAVGVLLALAVALRLLSAALRLPVGAMPFAAACWTAALVAVMAGFEIWSEAMLGIFAFAAFLFAAVARPVDGR